MSDEIIEEVKRREVDLLLISGAAQQFQVRQEVGPIPFGGLGLFVIDEVRYTSDWGHGFRRDCRKLNVETAE